MGVGDRTRHTLDFLDLNLLHRPHLLDLLNLLHLLHRSDLLDLLNLLNLLNLLDLLLGHYALRRRITETVLNVRTHSSRNHIEACGLQFTLLHVTYVWYRSHHGLSSYRHCTRLSIHVSWN